MANSNPYQARQAKRRRRKPGDLAALQLMLWTALLEAEKIMLQADDDAELTLKAAHCLSQLAGQYAKLLEVGEFEARLKALEDARGESHAGIA